MVFDELIDALAQNGWQIRRRDEICPPRGEFLGGRFKNLSEDFYRFVCSFEILSDAADAVWFVSARDYASPSSDEAEFHYGDFEKESLECAANDAQRAAVSAFWSGCLPFCFRSEANAASWASSRRARTRARSYSARNRYTRMPWSSRKTSRSLSLFSSPHSRTKAPRNIRFLALCSGMRCEQSGTASASKTAARCGKF